MTITPETEASDALSAAFGSVGEMEENVTAARDYASVLVRLDEATFADAEGACAVQRIGQQLREQIDEIEKWRGHLFRLLHPRRAEFEKTGWPDDKPAEDVD